MHTRSKFLYTTAILLCLSHGAYAATTGSTGIQMLPPVLQSDQRTACNTGTAGYPQLLAWDGTNPINCISGFYVDNNSGSVSIAGFINNYSGININNIDASGAAFTQSYIHNDGAAFFNGNVGVGVSPLAKLHVAAPTVDNNMTGILVEEHSSQYSSPRIGFVDTALGANTNAPAWFVDNLLDRFRIVRQPNITTPGYEFLTILNSGYVGLGTNNPRTTLEVNGSASFGDYGPWGSISMNRNWIGKCPAGTGCENGTTLGSNYLHISGWTNPNFGLNATGTTQRVIGLYDSVVLPETNARLGVGTTTPQASIDVNGGVKLGNDGVCNASKAGMLVYSSGQPMYCNGTSFVSLAGSAGSTGAQGPAGPAGATGAKGDKGDTGATGPAGASGIDSGCDGSTWTAATGSSYPYNTSFPVPNGYVGFDGCSQMQCQNRTWVRILFRECSSPADHEGSPL